MRIKPFIFMRFFTLVFCGLLPMFFTACASSTPQCYCQKELEGLEQSLQQEVEAIKAKQKRLFDFEAVRQSVVQIKVKVSETLEQGRLRESYEYGTGFFVDTNGLILTSAHVISHAMDKKQIRVFYQGRELQARLLQQYLKEDLALLLIDAGKTKALPFARVDVAMGEQIFTVGYPYVQVFADKKPIVSSGFVAGTKRRIQYAGEKVSALIATNAFVADGCSGGPVLNDKGHVVGISRFNLSKDGIWLGLSFAEPIASYVDKQE